MTPLEAGVLGASLVFFVGVTGWAFPAGPLWFTAVGVATVGAVLASGWGNFVAVGFVPGGSPVPADPVTYLAGHLAGDRAGADFKFVCLFLFALSGVAYLRRSGYETLLVGTIAVGAGLLTFATDNLVVLYLTLELQALSLYTLVGFYKFDEERTDAAVRYLLSGSLVSGFMLLGFARAYGLNGTFHLGEFTRSDPVGSAWVVGVLLFKVGVFPFHFWSPVVYAPLEWGTLGLVLGATKVNAWYLLVRNFAGPAESAWWPLWWAALGSVVVGSIGGYFQTNVASLLAYSGVINGGYLLFLSLAAPDGGFAFGYYAVVYFGGTLGLVVALSVFGDTKLTWFTGWNKLGVFYPLVVYYLCLNVAGLPVFPGFAAKLVLLRGTVEFGWGLLFLLVAASVSPAVYYVGVAGSALFGYADREVTPPAGVSPLWVAPTVVALSGGITTVGVLAGVA